MIGNMKKGSYIVNTARGKIMDRDALVDAVKSGHIEDMRVMFGSLNQRLKIIL
jgi:lactate dehydrogenase-like 2-hydroxyacid dehydrogenase